MLVNSKTSIITNCFTEIIVVSVSVNEMILPSSFSLISIYALFLEQYPLSKSMIESSLPTSIPDTG